jgi:hypothetical protein
MSENREEGYLQMMEELSRIVALYSGMRQQFIDAGWHPAHAEIATIEMMRKVG